MKQKRTEQNKAASKLDNRATFSYITPPESFKSVYLNLLDVICCVRYLLFISSCSYTAHIICQKQCTAPAMYKTNSPKGQPSLCEAVCLINSHSSRFLLSSWRFKMRMLRLRQSLRAAADDSKSRSERVMNEYVFSCGHLSHESCFSITWYQLYSTGLYLPLVSGTSLEVDFYYTIEPMIIPP